MDIPRQLQDLAYEFSKQNQKLFVVGGYVRDRLLGISPNDMDICGNIPLEDVKKVAMYLGFSCSIIQRELGTMSLRKEDVEVEYTRFRTEIYENGNHSPKYVAWVDDLKQDALRRDFTINAIYYDIIENKIVDPCGGQEDLQRRWIRTADQPKITLSRDGLRILRALRFKEQLGFSFERNTEKACKKYSYLLRDISKERITDELRKIFHAYEKCDKALTPYKIVHRLNQWRIWQNILSTLPYTMLPIGFFKRILYRSNHSFNRFYQKVYRNIPKELGYKGLLILLVLADLGDSTSESAIANSVFKVLGSALKETRSMQRSVQTIIQCMLQTESYHNLLSFRQFAINYHNYSADEKQILHLIDNAFYGRVEEEYVEMKRKNMPLAPTKLAISPQYLESLGYKGNELGQILNLLWAEVLLENLPNSIHDMNCYLNNRKQTNL